MLSDNEFAAAQARTLEYLLRAGIELTPDEIQRIEIADLGLGELEQTGLELITYVNTGRVCAKELVLFPEQTCPEHRHPPTAATGPGKEETFRCRWGTVYLNVPGDAPAARVSQPPEGSREHYYVFHEVRLEPGDQYTLVPDTPHWFQAGPEGAILSEFSTRSTDEADRFSDPRIARMPVIGE